MGFWKWATVRGQEPFERLLSRLLCTKDNHARHRCLTLQEDVGCRKVLVCFLQPFFGIAQELRLHTTAYLRAGLCRARWPDSARVAQTRRASISAHRVPPESGAR